MITSEGITYRDELGIPNRPLEFESIWEGHDSQFHIGELPIGYWCRLYYSELVFQNGIPESWYQEMAYIDFRVPDEFVDGIGSDVLLASKCIYVIVVEQGGTTVYNDIPMMFRLQYNRGDIDGLLYYFKPDGTKPCKLELSDTKPRLFRLQLIKNMG